MNNRWLAMILGGLVAVSLVAGGCSKAEEASLADTLMEDSGAGDTDDSKEDRTEQRGEEDTSKNKDDALNEEAAEDPREEWDGVRVGAGDPSTALEDDSYGQITYVDNVDDFLLSIADDTQIILEEGVYNLSEAKVDTGWTAEDQDYNEYRDYLYGVDNPLRANHLKVTGEGDVSIITEDGYSYVLTILDSDDVVLQNLTLGHEIEMGHCDGGVVKIAASDHVSIENCDLYGCGTYGATIEGVSYYSMENTVIHDCTKGLVELQNATDGTIDHCVLRDTDGPWGSTFQNVTGAIFTNCLFANNQVDSQTGFFNDNGGSEQIVFIGCTFRGNYFGSFLGDESGAFAFLDCTFADGVPSDVEDLLNRGEGSSLALQQGEDLGLMDLVGLWMLTGIHKEGYDLTTEEEGDVGLIRVDGDDGAASISEYYYDWSGNSNYGHFFERMLDMELTYMEEPLEDCENDVWKAQALIHSIEDYDGDHAPT